jgi:Zn-dependent peptidase ImmA (M78 family)
MTAAFRLRLDTPTEEAGGILRTALAIDAMPKVTVGRPQEFLRLLVRAAERLNVTVIQVQRVDVSVMRGFSLGDGPYPVTAVNGSDWPRGKAFTLLHELAHVGFRSNGLCDLEREDPPDIERRCDQVAAAALMPRGSFLHALREYHSRDLTTDLAREVGQPFGASGQSALLRMVELGRATWDDYWRLKPAFDDAFQHFKADEKAAGAEADSPIFYQLKARDLGRSFIRRVLRAYGEEAISTRDVVQLLEVSYDKVPKLARAARAMSDDG